MGLADTFGAEDRVQLKVSDLMSIMKSDALNWAQNTAMINGLKAHLPHNHILIMIGENPTCNEESDGACTCEVEYRDTAGHASKKPTKKEEK